MDSTEAAAVQIVEWSEQHQRLDAADRFVAALVNALRMSDVAVVDRVDVLHQLAISAELEATMVSLGGVQRG